VGRCKLGSDCRGCHLPNDLRRVLRSHPNKAVDVFFYQTLDKAFGLSASNSCLLESCFPNQSRAVLSRRLCFDSWGTATQSSSSPSRSAPTCHGATAHTPLPLPRSGAVTRPASGLPPPPLSSLHSSRLVHIAAARTVVNPCRVRTAPGYTARSPLGKPLPHHRLSQAGSAGGAGQLLPSRPLSHSGPARRLRHQWPVELP
jgi:hypothetical protein